MVPKFRPDSTARHYLACIPTLTLGIMGRSDMHLLNRLSLHRKQPIFNLAFAVLQRLTLSVVSCSGCKCTHCVFCDTLDQVLKHAMHGQTLTRDLTVADTCSAVLPVSSAFASTGIVAGFVIMVVVAVANAYTCDLLLWQAYKTAECDDSHWAACSHRMKLHES